MVGEGKGGDRCAAGKTLPRGISVVHAASLTGHMFQDSLLQNVYF